jgi:PAS domain S-box-containing protein
MTIQILRFNLDIATFTALVLLGTWIVHVMVRRSTAGVGLARNSWLILFLLLITGAAVAVVFGRLERERLQRMLEGFAPTYALESARLGHESITSNTAGDDPTYLRLIDAQKQWLSVNPAVNDIYTFALNQDGKLVFLVDSETDYDHDGKYAQEREQRTPIGEVYDEPTPAMFEALQGHAAFDGEPFSDRWGIWISAFAPIRDADGHVRAALGVDYDATAWVNAIILRRVGVLGFFAIAIVVLIWSGAAITITRGEVERRKRTEQSLRESEARIRAILDHEPEAVFVLDAAGEILESNPAATAMLELSSPMDIAGKPVIDFVEPEQRPAVSRWLETVLREGAASTLKLTTLAQRSGARQIDAHAVRLVGNTHRGDALLIVARDITAQVLAEQEREQLHAKLRDASRQAGMAEIATGVLHNIGNVLNTVNVSNHLLLHRLRQTRGGGLKKAVTLLKDNQPHLAQFLVNDERGRQLPGYLDKLADLFDREQAELLDEVRRMGESLDHMKAIVQTQQEHAKGGSNLHERASAAALFEDAVKLNLSACERHHVQIEREFEDVPAIITDRHKLLQILCNLIGNAKEAVKPRDASSRRIILRIRRGQQPESGADGSVRFEVEDNGVGIAPEQLSKIFSMGFTTRPNGHGFGLHSSANFARELGGTVRAFSDGAGQGARFVVEIPAVPTRTHDHA